MQRIARYLERAKLAADVIVVDDGSADGTAPIVETHLGLSLRVIRNRVNHGKGYSVRQGVLAATGTWVLFTDADLSAPIEELDKLLSVAKTGDADIVIGSRGLDRRTIQLHQSRAREVGGAVFNKMVQLLLGLRIVDTQCGFKLFHRERTRWIFEKQTRTGFGFDPEILFLAKRRGLRVREVPVLWSHAEGSKIRFPDDAIRMFLDLLHIRWNSLTGRYR